MEIVVISIFLSIVVFYKLDIPGAILRAIKIQPQEITMGTRGWLFTFITKPLICFPCFTFWCSVTIATAHTLTLHDPAMPMDVFLSNFKIYSVMATFVVASIYDKL